MRNKMFKKGAKIATKFLCVTVFTKLIKHGIIKGVKRMFD